MKLILDGNEYDVNEAMQKATLFDLFELKQKTGIGMKTLSDSLKRMGDLGEPEAFLDDENILHSLCALFWLCRRNAGEKVTIAEAADVQLQNVQFKVDDEPAADADPTPALTASDQGESAELTATTT